MWFVLFLIFFIVFGGSSYLIYRVWEYTQNSAQKYIQYIIRLSDLSREAMVCSDALGYALYPYVFYDGVKADNQIFYFQEKSKTVGDAIRKIEAESNSIFNFIYDDLIVLKNSLSDWKTYGDGVIALVRKQDIKGSGEIFFSSFMVAYAKMNTIIQKWIGELKNKSEKDKTATEQLFLYLLIGYGAGLIAIVVALIVFSRRMQKQIWNPLRRMVERMNLMSTGSKDMDAAEPRYAWEEIDQLGMAVSDISRYFRERIGLMEEMAKGNFDSDWKAPSGDVLGGKIEKWGKQLGLLIREWEAMNAKLSYEQSKIQKIGEKAMNEGAGIDEAEESVVISMNEMNRIRGEEKDVIQKNTEWAEKAGALNGNIRTDMDRFKTAVSEMRNTTVQVRSLIKDVLEIPIQANVIALNAGIEAVKAGESGKSFTVVSENIRVYAAQSAKTIRQFFEIFEFNLQRVDLLYKEFDGLMKIQSDINSVIGSNALILSQLQDKNNDIEKVMQSMNESVDKLKNVTQMNAQLFGQLIDFGKGWEESSAQMKLLMSDSLSQTQKDAEMPTAMSLASDDGKASRIR